MSIFAQSGEWVTKKTYDVTVVNMNGDTVAVVGFNRDQLDGAVFWQIDMPSRFDYDLSEIKTVAKSYVGKPF